jgi:hypothetical protein
MHVWNTDGLFKALPASPVLLKAAEFLTELLRVGGGEVKRASCCTSNLR